MPDPDNAEAFLLNFHARFAGATSDAMSHCARDGRSPYDVLAALVPDTAKPLTVLDLACGDGALLQLLARREQQGLHLVGVDMSPHELERARAILPPKSSCVSSAHSSCRWTKPPSIACCAAWR